MTIVSHKDGSYSFTHLTFNELNYIQNALCANIDNLKRLKDKMGNLNPFASASLEFSDKVSDKLVDVICG